MQKAYLFLLQTVIPATNCISVFPLVGCNPVAWAVQEEIGKSAANYLRISYTRLKNAPVLGYLFPAFEHTKMHYFRLSNSFSKQCWKVGNT